ncbi:zinc finger protein 691 [Drosophila grimshawi]|uniref:GH13680 n=1 Tax=Drosophila grimshawi TaxID=7222 RepID=B4JQD8_DROGR|nr:zinc finger protein 691 [Drosophila grimshawi]EDV99118.1 GH13680 [Drosophila grimshawi]
MEEVCRACMTSTVALLNIFADQQHPSLADMLNECVACAIKLEDELPKKICLACICDVKAAFEFKRRCEKSHQVLSSQLRKGEMKLEAPEEDIHPEPEHLINEECDTEKSSKRDELSHIPDSEPRQKEADVQSELLITENWELAESDIDLGCVKVEHDEDIINEQQKESSATAPPKELSTIASDAKKSQFLCPHCAKSFTQSSHLNAHIRTHTGERPYKCPHCPKAFSQASNLRKHICIHSGERPFKCPHCTRAFTRHTDLQYHISTHPGKQVYKCTHCTRYFIEQSELDEHMRYHNGERTYKCTDCSREFSSAWQLQRHIRTHTGEHPFKCPHCPKNCIDKGDLGRHIRSHTGERPYKCPHCPKAFTRAAYLKSHISTHPEILI